MSKNPMVNLVNAMLALQDEWMKRGDITLLNADYNEDGVWTLSIEVETHADTHIAFVEWDGQQPYELHMQVEAVLAEYA